MSNLSEQFSALIGNIRKRTHAQYAVIGAAIIEEQLFEMLLTKMRPLSRKMKERLFDGYGPLSTFSAKIDLSYALQILSKSNYDDLMVVRKIRNEFAHSIEFVNFDSPEIRAHFKHFTTIYADETDRQAYYLRRLKEIQSDLERTFNAAN